MILVAIILPVFLVRSELFLSLNYLHSYRRVLGLCAFWPPGMCIIVYQIKSMLKFVCEELKICTLIIGEGWLAHLLSKNLPKTHPTCAWVKAGSDLSMLPRDILDPANIIEHIGINLVQFLGMQAMWLLLLLLSTATLWPGGRTWSRSLPANLNFTF